MVELREITSNNYDDCLNLDVSDNQRNFVASNTYSLAQAWVFYDTAYPFAIYADDIMVGFVMMGYYKPKGEYTVWRFMIDKRFQGKGYGKAALALAIRYLKDKFNPKEIFLSFEPDNIIAEKLYYNAGFRRTGEVEGDEIVMRLKLN
jgi:diamine N-acetyltransferase